MAFAKATKSQAKGRFAITGPSGAGKTKTALLIAAGLGGKVAVLDSEHGSASKYADAHDFDVDDLSGDAHPDRIVRGIVEAEKAGYSVLIIDSLTHAWEATKAVVDKRRLADRSGNGFTAWSEGTRLWNALQDRIQASSIHIIVTMRAKTEYSQEKNDVGKTVIKKLGMAPEVRDGTEYAYDMVLDMDCDHIGRVSKTRCAALDGYAELKPGEALGAVLRDWLTDGVQPVSKPAYISQEKAHTLARRANEAGFTQEQIFEAVGSDPDKVTPAAAKAFFAVVEAAERSGAAVGRDDIGEGGMDEAIESEEGANA